MTTCPVHVIWSEEPSNFNPDYAALERDLINSQQVDKSDKKKEKSSDRSSRTGGQKKKRLIQQPRIYIVVWPQVSSVKRNDSSLI